MIDLAGDPARSNGHAPPPLDAAVAVRTSTKEYRLASREAHPEDSIVRVVGPDGSSERALEIGGRRIAMMVGPCAVESWEQLMGAAVAVRTAGFPMLRAGAFKPRTSPYSFQGLSLEGLRLLDEARHEAGLLVVTEVTSESDVDLVARHVDMLQIGARSMHSFRLIEAIAAAGKPILLKRGFQATIKEWLLAAEYILKRGNPNVVLCERGIRGFDDEFTRNVLDLNAVPVAKRETRLPVVVDPSHGTGSADLVLPMARAAIAAGADGLLIEAHPNPAEALSDAAQTLPTSRLPELAAEVERIAQAMGRTIYP